eukprot:s5784_g7.t2
MERGGLQGDEITMKSAMGACVWAGEWELALSAGRTAWVPALPALRREDESAGRTAWVPALPALRREDEYAHMSQKCLGLSRRIRGNAASLGTGARGSMRSGCFAKMPPQLMLRSIALPSTSAARTDDRFHGDFVALQTSPFHTTQQLHRDLPLPSLKGLKVSAFAFKG